MSIIQGSSLEILVKAEDGGSPVSGLDETNFDIGAWWPGLTAFSPVGLTAGDVNELGATGYYAVKMPGVTGVLGSLSLQIKSQITPFDTVEKEYVVCPAPLSLTVGPDTCLVSGNIADIGGSPGKGNIVRFRPTTFPTEQSGSIISSDAVETVPDALGNFSVALVRNQTVTVEITKSGVRNQIDIPDQETALLVDLLPPLN